MPPTYSTLPPPSGHQRRFSCFLVHALDWIEVGAESNDEGEVIEVGYISLSHKCHDNFNTSFDIGTNIKITSQHMRKELDIKFAQNASSPIQQVT